MCPCYSHSPCPNCVLNNSCFYHLYFPFLCGSGFWGQFVFSLALLWPFPAGRSLSGNKFVDCCSLWESREKVFSLRAAPARKHLHLFAAPAEWKTPESSEKRSRGHRVSGAVAAHRPRGRSPGAENKERKRSARCFVYQARPSCTLAAK